MGKQPPPRAEAGRLSGNSGVKKKDKMKNKKSSGPASGGGGGGAKGPGRGLRTRTRPTLRLLLLFLLLRASARAFALLVPGKPCHAPMSTRVLVFGDPRAGSWRDRRPHERRRRRRGGAKSAAAPLTPGRVAPPPPTYRLLDWANAAAPAAKVGPDSWCSPRRGRAFFSRNDGSTCVG